MCIMWSSFSNHNHTVLSCTVTTYEILALFQTDFISTHYNVFYDCARDKKKKSATAIDNDGGITVAAVTVDDDDYNDDGDGDGLTT